LPWLEVRDLVADGVIHNDWVGPGSMAIAALDHEQAAVCQFCDEIYEAWGRLQAARTEVREAA
jgi:hypothetical protein